MDYLPFSNVLQNIYDVKSVTNTDIKRSVVYTTVRDFCLRSKSKTFVVSLSGGVDSMVMLYVIHHLGFDCIAVHINYNNRDETGMEQHFLEEWCKHHGIRIYVESITDINRNEKSNINRHEYEIETKKIRFNLYKKVILIVHKEYKNATATDASILLGHHKDDTVENVLINICRARSILNLAVIQENAIIEGVNISRPLVNVYKRDIYEIAHQNGIPYFKDTTPTWSVRGIFRDRIMPSLHTAFKHNIKENLLKVNEQTSEWNELIQKAIIEPFLQNACVFDKDTVVLSIDETHRSYPFCFWNVVFMKVFYRYHHNCPSNKSVMMFMNFINTRKNGKFSLSNKCCCFLEHNKFSIYYNLNGYNQNQHIVKQRNRII